MKTRNQSLEVSSNREFDLVVIGGGIAGAGVAQDAASRGLSVALVEKGDFASGTSSRTTKLIHGGLRYLEQFHFKLTRELCQERDVLEHLAPHMVRDFSFVMPLPKGSPLLSLKASVGLTIYDLLSWPIGGVRHHQRLSQQEVVEAAPALSGHSFTHGLRFHDCITDDSRMVLEVIKSACDNGTVALNYMEVSDFGLEDGKIVTVNCHDRITGQDLSLRCRACVNATGVWSDDVFKLIETSWAKHLSPSKGIHIIVPASAFETNTALFLPTSDGRYVFVVPWHRALMIGTTDSPYSGNLDNPLPDRDEVDYLLSVVNSYTQSNRLNRSDINGCFAGLRPLIQHGDAKNTSKLSREHVIFEGPGGIIGLNGGKLTNYRLMAAQVVDQVYKKLPGLAFQASRSKRIMLGGWLDKQNYLATTAAISAKGRRLAVEPATLDHLVSNYGSDAQSILEIIEQDPTLNQRICPDFPPVMAEILFCVHSEMVVCLEDLLLRRLRLGILNQKQCLEAAPKVVQIMQLLLNWDSVRCQIELSALEDTLNQLMDSCRGPLQTAVKSVDG